MEVKLVHVNEWQGSDKNDGLSENTPVLTRKRADEIRRKERTQGLRIIGSEAFKKQFVSGSS
jgi:hypothetical protein